MGEVISPRNVFLYGRGGANDIHCIYRFEADSDERVRLILNNASFGGNPLCETVADPHSGRPSCEYQNGARVMELSIWELPWRDTRIHRGCICDNSSLSARPTVFLSSSGTLELHFTAKDMKITEDFSILNFHATFELVKMPACPRQQRLRGDGSDIHFNSPPVDRSELLCAGLPWMVEARDNKSLFLLSWGAALPLKVSIIIMRCFNFVMSYIPLYGATYTKYIMYESEVKNKLGIEDGLPIVNRRKSSTSQFFSN